MLHSLPIAVPPRSASSHRRGTPNPLYFKFAMAEPVARGTPIHLYFEIPMPSLVCLTSVSEKDHGMRAAPLAAVWFTEDAHGMGMPRRPLRHPTEGPVDALGYPSALDVATTGPWL
ncbi:hypothetical protein D9611_010844 [Ephemerocybe angulata]|uniref:Uncharacterized protein n=1 Tax=Ephemerocybe angulata TaxID=980116 RepID=A0A8H5C5L7_9AGAR|nr:hypothetical protein D9611_010844 [Tulosesus angulatus]